MNINTIIDAISDLQPSDFGRLKASLITHAPYIVTADKPDEALMEMLWEVQKMRPSKVVSLFDDGPSAA